jgi:hypothetical protein
VNLDTLAAHVPRIGTPWNTASDRERRRALVRAEAAEEPITRGTLLSGTLEVATSGEIA